MLPESLLDRSRTCRTEITIDAPQQLIWDMLIDLDHYADWNPFTYGYTGSFVVGGRFMLKVRLTDKFKLGSPEIVHLIEPPDRLAWCGDYPRWLVAATRYQVLRPLSPTQTHYQTWETFRGALAFVVMATLGKNIERGFQDVAVALKARAEQRYMVSNNG